MFDREKNRQDTRAIQTSGSIFSLPFCSVEVRCDIEEEDDDDEEEEKEEEKFELNIFSFRNRF